MLAENKIIKVENLRMLTNLQFLDLSDNQIETFEAGLKLSLIICIWINSSLFKLFKFSAL